MPLWQSAAHNNGHHRHLWGSPRHSDGLPQAVPLSRQGPGTAMEQEEWLQKPALAQVATC